MEAQMSDIGVVGPFERCEEFAGREAAERAVPQGTVYDYMCSSFLDGIINHVEIHVVLYLNRYRQYPHAWDGPVELDHVEQVIASLNAQPHTKYRAAGVIDDVVLLGSSENSYWMFWYDMDSSDCKVGRSTKNSDGFTAFVEECCDFIKSGHEIGGWSQLPAPKGWISW
jgi:hypothetical protein